VDSEEEGAEVELDSLQSFDPGELFRKLELFQPLRKAREAAEKGPPDRPAPPAAPEATTERGEAGGSGVLDAILDATQARTIDAEPGTPEEIDAFVREAVRPHLVRDDPDAKNRIAAADEVAGIRVSELLHRPPFQRMEAIWRSLVFLLSRVDTTGKVRVYLVHLPKAELARDLPPEGDPVRSRLYGLLSAPDLGNPGRKWALALGAYEFGMEAEDLGILERVAAVCREADVPWLSALEPGGEGGREAVPLAASLQEPGKAWRRLRESPGAPWLGLTYPRFLLREPYGEGSRRVKGFAFREEVRSSKDLLWGYGPILPAALLAQGFAASGWGVPPDHHLELAGMPLGNLPGDRGVSPTSLEVSLSPTDAGDLMELGIIPLVGFPDRAGVRVGGMHSVVGPTTPLASWWRSGGSP
jgi:type VI secretion system protein ImpC